MRSQRVGLYIDVDVGAYKESCVIRYDGTRHIINLFTNGQSHLRMGRMFDLE
jgi:hypothetical protein